MMQAMVPATLVHCSMGNAILLSACGIVIARTEVPLLLTTYRGLSKYYQAHLITDLEAKDDNQISQVKKGGQKGLGFPPPPPKKHTEPPATHQLKNGFHHILGLVALKPLQIVSNSGTFALATAMLSTLR